MEAWEALDVDDSDLPSLLRPCKRRHATSATQSQSNHLTPSSTPHLTQSLSLSPPSQSQTLDSRSHQQFHSTPLIPGPAGVVQSAMLRKTRDLRSLSSQDQEPPIATQEYIRRAIEDAEQDNDFKRNPWSSAIEFITADGVEDGVIPSSPLSSIKRCLNIGRADQVVAVIKSCTPNGLGDLMVTLKDPTGTVAGFIHRKVLSEGEFTKDISVGSVLILQKVAIFAPSRSAHYLNITHSNVVKVFHKDSGPPLQQNDSPACAIKYAAPGTEYSAETRMLRREFPLEHGRTKDMMNEIRTSGNARGNLHDNNHQDRRNSFRESVGQCSNPSGINITQNATVGKEPLLVRQSGAKEIFNEAVRMEMSEDECRASGNNEKLSNGGNLSCILKHTSIGPNSVGNCSEKELMRIDAVQRQKESLLTSASLPQWTDEQLKELFALDYEDDGFDM